MGAPIGVVQGAFILRKKAPALKIQTRLLAQWIGNCILQTHRLRREMPEFVEALGKAYESYEVGGEREEFPKTTPFTFNGEKFFIHAFWIRHVARAFSVYLSAQGLGATPIRCPQVAFSILKRIGGRWCILQFQTCVEGSRIGVWDRDLGVQLGRELKRWHSLDRVRLNGSLAHGRILSVSDFLHTFRELEQSPDRESIKDFDIGVIDRARFYLSDPSLIGQSALCHGDIHWNNLLQKENGELVWFDLDSVGLAPARQELAWATYFLLGRHADAAESLEENYFESEPEAFQGWHRCRLHWCVIQGVYRAAHLLKKAKCLPGHRPLILENRNRTLEGVNAAFQKALKAQHLLNRGDRFHEFSTRQILEHLSTPHELA